MNFIGKVRVRSLEEINNNQNLFFTSLEFKSKVNLVEQNSEMQESQLEKFPVEQTIEPQKVPTVSFESTIMQTDCVSPTLEKMQHNSNEESKGHIDSSIQSNVTRIESEEELSGECDQSEKEPAHIGNVSLDLEKGQSENSTTPSKSVNTISELLNTEYRIEHVSPVLVLEANNETDDKVDEPSTFSVDTLDESFCLMEFVETVFGVGCDGENFNCHCAPIQIEIEEEDFPENSAPSPDYGCSIIEETDLEKSDNISFHNKQTSVQSKSPILNIDDKTNSKLVTQIPDPLLDSKSETNCRPTTKSPDKVSLNLFVSPNHKLMAGTTFAIDDFRYNPIADVTAIFLTHFHMDQFYNLRKNYAKPIYLSGITAKVLRELLPSKELVLKIMDLNNTITVDGVQVTALDANYCPGSIMLLFQLSCGVRILYTGDFRASLEMELNPFLREGKIDILYLDMTYISRKNNLSLRRVSPQSQEKSISDAIILIRKFKETHDGKRILFVFGHNVLENGELWLQIADTFDFKVWTDEFRSKMFTAIGNEEYIQRLVPNAQQADMHLVQYSDVSYHGINEYWKGFKDEYDVVLAIKPNQWVDIKRRPLFKGEINIAEIEYSAHSIETEIRRFLAFVQPKRVITIVPAGKDKTKYPDVPLSWYKEKWLSPVMKQASMFDFFKAKQKK